MPSPLNFVSLLDHQKKTYWDFFFTDNPTLKYRIKTTNLVLPRFEIETRHTWENFYTQRTVNTTFEIELYEDIAFSTYRYFKIWMDLVYNPFTRKFISYPGTTPETSPIYKNAIFNYYAVGGVIQTPPTKQFIFQNVKLVGIGDISNDYEDGNGLTYTVTIAFENILDF